MSDDYVWFKGVPFLSICKYETLKEIHGNFVMKDDDTVVVTYPKSGTNWLNEILCLIHSNGDPTWIQSVLMWERFPWIEYEDGYNLLKDQKGPRCFATHLPIHTFPRSFFNSKAKVIYLLRNPRDVLVSGYHFYAGTNFAKKPKSLEEFFEWFIQGNVPYGLWVEHVRGWLTMQGRENFLVLTYEELKKDTKSTVEKICEFLGKKLKPEELGLVLKHSSFEVMKENKMSNFSMISEECISLNFSFMRKGTIGDWKNHLTIAQVEAFDKIFQEKMAGFPQELFQWT